MRILTILMCVAALILLNCPSSPAAAPRILMLETMPVPVVLDHERYFLEGLEALGYKIGDSVIIDKIEAQGDIERARTELRRYLAKRRPDIVASFATLASQAANEILVGTGIPLVFSVVSDPVGSGLVERVGQPTGTNVTGLVFSLMRQSKIGLARQLLTQPFPDRSVRVGVVHTSYPAAVREMELMAELNRRAGKLEFHTFKFDYRPMPQGLEAMLVDARKGVEALKNQIDFWWVVPGPLGETVEFTEMLLESGLPVGLCHTMHCVSRGGLFAVNTNYKDSGFQVAKMVDSILRGIDPGTIPSVPPDSFDLGINLKTAIDLRIVVPSDLVELAGEKVWR